MKSKTTKIQTTRKHLYKLLDSFNEIDLYAVESFAAFLKKNKTDKNDSILKILENSAYETNELNENTIKSIKKARSEYSKGKYYTLEQVKKEIGI